MGITEDIEETGETLRENSIIKAQYIYERTRCNCFADDTGLMVDALDGAPGVHSARYATDGHDFNANIDKLLRELSRVGAITPSQRRARFRNVITLILDGEMHIFEGNMEGAIAPERQGVHGFGYDPVFIADELPGQPIAAFPEGSKNQISHRGKSLRAMAEFLKKN